jgi:RimJ/RimL family protein N-acetyltransferase
VSLLTTRRFERADRDACARIFECVQREVFAGDDPALYRARRFERDTEGEEIWVAEIGGQIVGLATLWRRQPFVHYLLIDRAARGRGVGRALLESMLAGVHGPVDLKCRTNNLAARRFYERLGWTEVERVEDAAAPYVRYRLDRGVMPGDARRGAASRRRPTQHATAR